MAIDTTTGGVVYGTGDFYTHVLNDLFLPGVADTVITPNTLLSRLPRDKTRVEGKNVVFPIHTGRNRGISAIGADGTLPDPGSQEYNRYAFPVRFIYGRVKFDGITMDASASDVASWLRVIESEVKGMAKDMSRYRQRAFWNDGSGILCEINETSTNDATHTVRLNQDLPNAASTTEVPTKNIRVGMLCAVIDDPGGSPHVEDIATVSSFTDTTITWDAFTGTVAPGDLVVHAAAEGATALKDTGFQREPMGVMGIVRDDNPNDGVTGFQGIDAAAAANSWHRATIIGSGAPAAVTRAKFDQAYTKAIEIGDVEPTAIYTSFGVARAYANSIIGEVGSNGYTGARRYVNVDSFDGGHEYLSHNNAPIIADRDCWKDKAYFLHEPDLRVYVLAEPKWMNMDGSIYHRLNDKDAYQATLLVRETLGSDVRDRQVLLDALLEA